MLKRAKADILEWPYDRMEVARDDDPGANDGVVAEDDESDVS